MQEQTPATEKENSFASQVEGKEVGQTGITASEQGLSKGSHFIFFAHCCLCLKDIFYVGFFFSLFQILLLKLCG